MLRLFSENFETGEVTELSLDDYKITDIVERNRLKSIIERKAFLDSLGDYPFVWAIYQVSTSLLDQLSSTHVTMLFYLITYCGYSGFLTSGKLPIKKEQLPKLLKVSRTTAWRFWDAISTLNICSEAGDGRIEVNRGFFRRGDLAKKELAALLSQNKYVTRIYIDAIRDLYDRSTATSRKTLCHLFQIIPFLHREYNIVCHNPLEEVLEEVVPMNLGEFCRAVGYSDKNAARLLSALLESKFQCKGKLESAVRYVVSDKLRDKRSYNMFVNPNVYYAGNHWDQVKILGRF